MGTATIQGQLWGARADDWATIQEWAVRPAYDAILDRLGPWHGKTLLDVGCGAGAFASLAAARGARVAGIDAAPELIDIAERRVSSGAFRVGEMESLPYANSSFTVACGLISFQYAQDPTHALLETARVVRPGGTVVGMAGGTVDECEAAACVQAIEALLPAPVGPPAAPFSADVEELGKLFTSAGLTAGDLRAVPCPWYYPDERTALRGLLSTGPAVRAIGHSGEEAVAAAALAAIAPYRFGNGSYLLRNTFYYTVATV